MIRSFFALELSPDALKVIEAAQKHLAQFEGVYRPIGVEQLHLTLAFLGENDEETTAKLGDLAAGLEFPRLALGIQGWVPLPKPDVPRVLAVNIADESGELVRFQRRLQDRVFQLAAHKETRPFVPHITFARLKKEVPASAKVVKKGLAAMPSLRSDVWTPGEYLHLARDLSGDSARYQVLRRYPGTGEEPGAS